MRKKTSRIINLILIFLCCVTLGLYFKKQPYFSIIVSSYNYGHFLPETVNSILNSTYSNYELIIVNDGSTDKTSEILKMYKNNPKITIIEHENMGLSLSRNKAMKIARGKYFWFVDADDFIDKKALERLYKKTKNTNLDVVSFYTGPTREDGSLVKPGGYDMLPHRVNIKPNKIWTVDDLGAGEILSYPVTSGKQIYRRNFIQEHNIEFPPRTLFEDDVFFLHTLFSGAKISAITSVLYYKRGHRNAITADKSKYFDSFVRICQYIWDRTHINPDQQKKATDVSNIYINSIPARWNWLNEERRYKFYPELLKMKEYIEKHQHEEYWRHQKIWFEKFLTSPEVDKYKTKPQ